MNVLQGISASPGIAIGPAFLFQRMVIQVDCHSEGDPA